MDFSINNNTIILVSALFLLTLLLITLYRGMLRHPVKCKNRDNAAEPHAQQQPVSIVVYARDNSRRLELLLHDLLAQEYRAPYEIIVVNDSNGYECSDVVTRLGMSHSNLRMTFVPENAHNLSRKKLAITLGMKAARYPFVLLLNAECRIPSPLWLQSMTRDTSKITLGQAIIVNDDDADGPLHRPSLMMQVDEAATAIKWIRAASRDYTYRGNGYNIGYPSKLFFDHDGFAGSLNLQAGDDDIFINKISLPGNSRVELSDDALVHVATSRARDLYNQLKVSHIFTARKLPSQPMILVISCLLWGSLALAIVASIFSLPSLVGLISAMVLLLTQWIVISITFNRSAHAVGITSIKTVAVIPSLLWLPFHNMRYRMKAMRDKSQHYTWQRKKQ